MMKRLFKTLMTLAAFVFVISCTTTNQNNKNDWSRFGLQGEVKLMDEKSHKAVQKFGEWQSGKLNMFGHSILEFDETGRFISREVFDARGGLMAKHIPKVEGDKIVGAADYDKYGKLTSKYVYDHKSDSEVISTTYDEDGEALFVVTEFFENGKLIKLIRKDDKGEEVTIEFSYDSDMNIIGETHYSENGEKVLERKCEYLEFDDKNNWTKRLDYDLTNGDGSPENIIIRELEYF